MDNLVDTIKEFLTLLHAHYGNFGEWFREEDVKKFWLETASQIQVKASIAEIEEDFSQMDLSPDEFFAKSQAVRALIQRLASVESLLQWSPPDRCAWFFIAIEERFVSLVDSISSSDATTSQHKERIQQLKGFHAERSNEQQSINENFAA